MSWVFWFGIFHFFFPQNNMVRIDGNVVMVRLLVSWKWLPGLTVDIFLLPCMLNILCNRRKIRRKKGRMERREKNERKYEYTKVFMEEQSSRRLLYCLGQQLSPRHISNTVETYFISRTVYIIESSQEQ